MRTPFAAFSITTLAATLALSGLACQGNPNDPMTWAKELKNLRVQKEALDRLANMDVERARPAVPALIELYKDTRRPEHLEAMARYHDPRTKPLMIEALEYSDDDFDRATIAAGVLGEMKATEAVDPLIKAVEKQLPIKSRANNVRIASMRALVKIGDKRAVPVLMKVLTTSADDQDFLLNQKAALALAEFRDPQAIPALIRGLFMTGRGTTIFQECRLALVRIGAPAIGPMVQLLQEKNPEIQEMAAKYKFEEPPPVGPRASCRTRRPSSSATCAPSRRPRADRAPAPEGARRRAPLGAHRARVHRHAARRRRDRQHPQGPQGRPGRARLGGRLALPVGRSPRGADADGDRQDRLREDRRGQGLRPARQRRDRACPHRRQGDLRAFKASPRRRPRSRACSGWRWTGCRSRRSATRTSRATARS